jgi:hypothetical protein
MLNTLIKNFILIQIFKISLVNISTYFNIEQCETHKDEPVYSIQFYNSRNHSFDGTPPLITKTNHEDEHKVEINHSHTQTHTHTHTHPKKL